MFLIIIIIIKKKKVNDSNGAYLDRPLETATWITFSGTETKRLYYKTFPLGEVFY